MVPNICFLIERPNFSAHAEGRLLSGYAAGILADKCSRAGLVPSQYAVSSLEHLRRNTWTSEWDIIITLGESALRTLTGKQSIWKWHLSCLDALPEYLCRKVVPTFDFNQMNKDWQLTLYFEMAVKRAAQNATPGPWVRKEERYVLGPSIDEAIARLESLAAHPPDWYSVDIETGRNQINTFGVAWSPNDAIAIKVLPDGVPSIAFKKVWDVIAGLCESDVPKVMQNGIYERTYLSRYGIHIRNFRHDTMCAQKFLWPELEKGLDNVGRIYTMEPYWKDDGRVSTEEGRRKDWGDIRDWTRHFTYNCRDTTNTLIAMHAQRKELAARNLLDLHDKYLVRLYDCVAEMGTHGLPLCTSKQELLIAEYETKSAELVRNLTVPINPRSPKAKLKLLKDKGYVIPVKKATGKESTDELSLKKLRLKYPADTDLRNLIEIGGIEKALSSYLRVKTLPDKRIRFMLDAHGTETGRMSCSMDPWDGGFNAQTLTSYCKKMIEWAPADNRVFVEIDLSQAESRFVAYDACEETLLGILERKEDIHKFVAAEIFQKPMADVTHEERQLGKKSGHGANYAMGVATFQESALKELDLVLDRKMATRVLESYHCVFPNIRRWHAHIRNTIYRERKLDNPFGQVRYFYGRMSDATYREGYAYRPQSTIPSLTNHLLLNLWNRRTEGMFPSLWFALQVHDSIILSANPDTARRVMDYSLNLDNWHPDLILPAGKLRIPTECKWSACLGKMEKYYG